MKRLFFYSNIDYDDNAIGITKKVKAQVKAFQELGFEVLYSCYKQDSFAIINGQTGEIHTLTENHFYNTKMNHALRRFGLMRFVSSWLKKEKFEIIYLRYHYFDKYMLDMLSQAQKSADKVVMEMHSFPCLGNERLQDKVFRFLESIYQEKCVERIDVFANMSSNLLPFNKPQVSFRNTIDSESISIRHPKLDNNVLKMLSVAYERPAHGFDRVIRGLSEYYNSDGTQNIHIVFAGRYMDSTKKLVKDLGLQEHCEFIPPASGEKLDLLYDQANIAIGHLANHRVNSFSGSAIKTQEFLAKGIPFIYAWNEAMLQDDYPYALKFQLCEDPIDFDKIIDWWRKLSNQDANFVAYEMRAFFDESAGWKNQMKLVLDFIDR